MTEKIIYKGLGASLIALLLSIIALFTTGYLYYQGFQLNNLFSSKLNYVQQVTREQIQLNKGAMEKLQTQVKDINDVVIKLSGNNNLNLLQLNELISMANQSLLVYNDVKSAIKILNYALEVSNTDNNANYIELKINLSNDIENLKQIQYVDVVLLSVKLNMIQNQIVGLALVPSIPVLKSITNQISNVNNLTLLQKFIYNFKQTFTSLVTISSLDSTDALQLLPEKDIILRSNIKLDLLNARIALLDHNQAIWVFNLTSIKNNLDKYFMKNAATTLIMQNIDFLLQTDISTKSANIDATLQSLVKLNVRNSGI